MCAGVYVCVHAGVLCVQVCMYSYMYVCVQVCMKVYMCVQVCMCRCVCVSITLLLLRCFSCFVVFSLYVVGQLGFADFFEKFVILLFVFVVVCF